MTRRLPWDRGDDAPTRTPVKKNSGTSASSRRVATPQSATAKTSTTSTPRQSSNRHPARSNGFLGERSPSTSPPPEPLPETLMIEGLENDDKYRMVEDELFVVAGQFTAHLHAAEYQRLKTQTRTQNAETIQNISRPVVGSLTELARKRQEELLRKKKQREAIRQAKRDAGNDDESGNETNVPWRGTSLQGLMDSPRKKEVPLMALTRMDSGTKASTLFGGPMRSQNKRPAATDRREEIEEETEDESDDDLGGPVGARVVREVARSAPVAARPTPLAKPTPRAPIRPTAQTQRNSNSASLAATSKPVTQTTAHPATAAARTASSTNKTTKTPASVVRNDDNDDDDDDDPFTRFKKRKANPRQRRVTETKGGEKSESSVSRDIIPSFI